MNTLFLHIVLGHTHIYIYVHILSTYAHCWVTEFAESDVSCTRALLVFLAA